MESRPGYVWSGTEWVRIGGPVIQSPIYYQASAPSSPSTGDIWVESDVNVPTIASSSYYRWRKTMVGGETTLSGTDDNSLTLAYSPNYEMVFLNGVMLTRGIDYTATTGSTVTGLTAFVANDVVEVMSPLAFNVADVYTQSQVYTKSQSDAKYVELIGDTMTGSLTTSGTMIASDFDNSSFANTAWSSTGITVTNFSGTNYYWRVYNGVFYLEFYGIWSGGTVTSDAAGNITDTTICTIPVAYVPRAQPGIAFDMGGVTGAVGIASNTGAIIARSGTNPSTNILVTGRSVSFSSSWCLV